MKKLSLILCSVAILCIINVTNIRADGTVSPTNSTYISPPTVIQTEEVDSQLNEIDMQNSLQKQQQTIQLMSNVSKMIQDAIMAIIRKIG